LNGSFIDEVEARSRWRGCKGRRNQALQDAKSSCSRRACPRTGSSVQACPARYKGNGGHTPGNRFAEAARRRRAIKVRSKSQQLGLLTGCI